MKDTIVAVATSLGTNAGINIIRISGSLSLEIAKNIFLTKNKELKLTPNMMTLGRIKGKNFEEKAFCVFYKAPYSYTGEDCIEIHCHGGINVTNAIVRLVRENGARPAEKGEFTKRAFLNGKLTLNEAEGISDMINASSEIEIRNAFRLMNGDISKEIIKQENNLLTIMSLLEAKLDYPEELEEETHPQAKEKLNQVIKELDFILKNTKSSKLIKNGVDVAIIGLPNAGKSSLLNVLINQDRAIVTEIAGTTRDTLTESVEINGVLLNFIDTAGIRECGDFIEKIGIERAKNTIMQADIVLFVRDDSDINIEKEAEIENLIIGKKVIIIDNKIDKNLSDRKGLKISTKDRQGIEELIEKIMVLVDKKSLDNQCIITSERQIFALQSCLKSLKYASESYDFTPSECILVEIRSGLEDLCKITGREVNESIVDEVFSNFCVGK